MELRETYASMTFQCHGYHRISLIISMFYLFVSLSFHSISSLFAPFHSAYLSPFVFGSPFPYLRATQQHVLSIRVFKTNLHCLLIDSTWSAFLPVSVLLRGSANLVPASSPDVCLSLPDVSMSDYPPWFFRLSSTRLSRSICGSTCVLLFVYAHAKDSSRRTYTAGATRALRSRSVFSE